MGQTFLGSDSATNALNKLPANQFYSFLSNQGMNMGNTVFGSDARQTGSVNLLDPQQQQFFNSTLNATQMPANQALTSLLQGFDPNQLTDFYQKGLVNPSLRTYEQQILPSIRQQFTDANAYSSSALNQALAQSANTLSENLTGQMAGLLQQGRQQAAGNQLGALGQVLGLLGQRNFSPIVQGPQAGLLADIVAALAKVGGAAI